jgi:hypothetical protein
VDVIVTSHVALSQSKRLALICPTTLAFVHVGFTAIHGTALRRRRRDRNHGNNAIVAIAILNIASSHLAGNIFRLKATR